MAHVEEVVAAGFRASPQQRHLWSTSQTTDVVSWRQLTVLVDGELDPSRLAEALRTVSARHEILRTRLAQPPGHTVPVQLIDEPAEGLTASYDLTGVIDEGVELDRLRAGEVAALAAHDGRGLRVVLAQLDRDRFAVVFTARSVLADGYSLRRLLTEIAITYADGETPSADVVQYADYAAWHNELLGSDERAHRRRRWDSRLESRLTAALDGAIVSTDGPSGSWATCRARLSDEAVRGVGTLTAHAGESATPSGRTDEAVIAAAWSVLLWRLGSGEHAAFLVAVSGRPYAELASALGPLARTTPVLVPMDAEMTFDQLVAWMGAELAEAAEHADDLDPNRLGTFWSARPGFEYVDEFAPITAQGVTFHSAIEDGRDSAPVTLRVVGPSTGDRWIDLRHDTRRLEPGRANELLARLCVLLDSAATHPTAPVGVLRLTLPGEEHRLLADGTGPPQRSQPGQRLHELFGQQALRTPLAIAVDDGQVRLTYAELAEQSGRFARHLIEAGLRPASRAVIFMERSAELVVALLAVLRAGAAYVPVDISQPARRLAFVVADVDAPLVVTGGQTAIPADASVPIVRYRADADGGAELPDPVGDDPVAYVMYTSGSTGVPNGVPVTHSGLLNYLLWAVDAYDMTAGTGSLVHSSVGFDLTVTALLGPLLVCQRVILVPESASLRADHTGQSASLRADAAPSAGLVGLANALRIAKDLTLVKVTPSHLTALSQLIDPADLAGRVRTLVIGGEQLYAETLAPFRSGAPHMRIINEYGPTETVVGSSAYEVGADSPQRGPVPIGSPIAGTTLHLLDDRGQLVPDGVAGEVYIGGAGVAAGYLGRDALSRERFVPDPFGGGGRLYRTGDRARRQPTGELVYLGRVDDQVKIRGVRVEPGEVEAVLRKHPDIADAAVVVSARPTSDGGALDNWLVAHVIANSPIPPTSAELTAFCRDHLVDALVPAVFVTAAALPTTANGKVDRSALRRLAVAPSVASEYVSPRTETEEILAGAIGAVLGRESVGIDDNYFVIGGDSIRSVMVASRAQARGLPVSVADLHQNPTIRQLAVALTASRASAPEPKVEAFALVPAEDRALMPPDVEDAFPLNLLQEGMIFHRDFAAKSAVYHAIASVRLRAPFDLDVLRMVIGQLVRRHPMLRTSFDQSSFSRPLQLVHRTFRDPLSYEDLRGLPAETQQGRIDAFVASEKQRGFELDEYPLIRFMAQRLDDDVFQFTYGFHHEIVDGWSEALMVTELFGHYFSVIFDEPLALAPPRTSMREAVALEIEALANPDNYAFWSSYLEGATLMRLPRPHSAPAADKGAREIVRVTVPVSQELSDQLKRLATANAVPLKTVLLASHMAVMHHYHGEEDTLTYTVTNGRPESADGSTAIGLFVNSLALRLTMSGGSWNDLIARTLDSERQSMPYRRLPMAELKRHQGNEPLAETLFFFTDYHVFRELDRWRYRGVDHVASELYGESTFPFCAIFRLNRESARLEVRIEYDCLQLSPDLIESMADCYVRVLTAMVDDPDGTYHTRPLVSQRELHQALVLWNGSGSATAQAQLIHDVIAAKGRSCPDAIAVASAHGALSYAALDRWAAKVADALRTHGAAPEKTVGLLTERSVEAIVCLLGILKTGAAYLPLDPSYPDERLRGIVRSAAPLAVLAQAGHADRVTSVPVIPIRPGLPDIRGEESPGGPVGSPDQAAYVMYTSGSTGEPKGVAITHAALVTSTLARADVYAQPPERFLLLSSLVFDSSVVGLFWPLCTGGTLVVPPEGIQLEPAELSRHMAEQAITHTLCVPSLLAALLDVEEHHRLRGLRVVIAAGEASSRELYERHRAAVPNSVFFNEYGPTENSVWSTVWSGEPPAHRPQLPIGRPVPGVRTYVINSHLQPVPVGVAGELYLGGVRLARGYVDRPGLTAASFLPDPFADQPGARMYRSGDLGRFTPDGELEFLGRVDNQVKIRGFRVELGEIETVLDAHPDIHRSVVVAREDHGGGMSLVAYVAARPGATPDEATIQRYVRDRLPKYMVPAAWVVLDALPLTATGKVDRSSLPAPDITRGRDVGPVPPRTETEQIVAAVWGQVLGIADFGVDDDFFDLGGESLGAMHVVTKANKLFGLDLSVRTLFDLSTVASFARAVDEARSDDSRPAQLAAAAD